MQTAACDIRTASAPERQLAAWLLPRALGMSPLSMHVEPSVLVAYVEDRLAGALALACAVAPNDPPTVPCAVHVVPWARRRGVGKALLAEAERLALHWGVRGLSSFDAVREGSPEAHGWAWLGFDFHVALERFRCSVFAMRDVLEPLWRRVRSHGNIPPRARLTSLAEAPADEVRRLRAMHLGGSDARGAVFTEAHDPDISRAAWTPDGRLAGILACRGPEDGAVFVDTRVVAPGERGGWANLCMMREAVEQGIAKGATAIVFEAGPAHQDTVSLARRAGGELVHRNLRFVRVIQNA